MIVYFLQEILHNISCFQMQVECLDLLLDIQLTKDHTFRRKLYYLKDECALSEIFIDYEKSIACH